MATVTFKGTPVRTQGSLPAVGSICPRFELTNKELEDVNEKHFQGKKKILNIFVSLDTSVCALSIKKFADHVKDKKGLIVLNISQDLPFAFSRFCDTNKGLDKNVETLSAFRSRFGEDLGLKITEGALRGLLSRAVMVLDENNRVLYAEQVPEITQEPSYEKALAVLYY